MENVDIVKNKVFDSYPEHSNRELLLEILWRVMPKEEKDTFIPIPPIEKGENLIMGAN